MVAFAALTGDCHPQHTDAEWAARSPFGERIAHGMLDPLATPSASCRSTPSASSRCAASATPSSSGPCTLGDTIRVERRIAATVAADDDTGLVDVRLGGPQPGRPPRRPRTSTVWRRNEPARTAPTPTRPRSTPRRIVFVPIPL